MKKAVVISLVALLFNSVGVFAQPLAGTQKDFAADYDAFIRKTMEKLPDIPALAVVVIKDDKPIFMKAYGMADREAGVKADVDTLFYIASSTKAYTALAAETLDREGKIKFSDPVTKYTSGIQFKTPIPEKITIRDLLTHTSGLKNDALVNRMAFSGQIDPREISNVFANATTFVDTRYGKYNYDNLGYNIYGVLVEKNLNKKWQDLLQERVFDPAGMKHTTAYISRAPAKKWTVAAPYIFDPAAGKTIRSVLDKKDNNMQAAGGIFTSISDIGRWLNMNMNAGKLNGKQVLPADLFHAAHTGYTKVVREDPPFTGEGEYGLGWQIGKYKNEKVIYHHGGYPGYSSHFSYLPDRKIAVAVVTNNDPVGVRAGHMLATYAYDQLLGMEGVEAEYEKQLQNLSNAYEERKKAYMADAASRAKRTWQLTKPFPDYAGKYTNEAFGTIEIIPKENALAIRMGNLNTIATPYTQSDTIRVVMLPGGSGEVIAFTKDAEGKVTSLTYGGVTFTKVAS
jgi:CubicO group peptidase (beta-lactamase class C family)